MQAFKVWGFVLKLMKVAASVLLAGIDTTTSAPGCV